jgi:hypothetical protein
MTRIITITAINHRSTVITTHLLRFVNQDQRNIFVTCMRKDTLLLAHPSISCNMLSASMVTGWRPRNLGSITTWAEISSPQECADWLWNPPTLLFSWHISSEIRRPGRFSLSSTFSTFLHNIILKHRDVTACLCNINIPSQKIHEEHFFCGAATQRGSWPPHS